MPSQTYYRAQFPALHFGVSFCVLWIFCISFYLKYCTVAITLITRLSSGASHFGPLVLVLLVGPNRLLLCQGLYPLHTHCWEDAPPATSFSMEASPVSVHLDETAEKRCFYPGCRLVSCNYTHWCFCLDTSVQYVFPCNDGPPPHPHFPYE